MKKGVLFSLISILVVVIVFSILILQRETISFEREQLSMKQQLEDVDYAYNSISRSLHILADVTTKRAIVSSLSYIIENGSFFEENRTEENLKELILNGTLRGEEIPFMKNNTLDKAISDLEIFYTGEPRKYNVSIELDKISITINDSFHILFNSSSEVNISKTGIARFSRKIKISERISINDFEDPLYLINITEGKGSRIIKKSKYIDNFTKLIVSGTGKGWCYGELTDNINADESEKKIFVNKTVTIGVNKFCGTIFENNETSVNISYLKVSSISNLTNYINSEILLSGEKGKAWNITNFIKHVENSWYINSTTGPSFFDRLEGKTYCSYCTGGNVGLETFVDKNHLLGLSLDIDKNATNIAYKYINGILGESKGFNESSTNSSSFKYFKIDDSSYSNYFE